MHLTPLKCWVAVDKDGVVLCGHCLCMAGLGEVCSHVAAVLFLLEDWGRKSKDIPNSVSVEVTTRLVCCLFIAKMLFVFLGLMRQ